MLKIIVVWRQDAEEPSFSFFFSAVWYGFAQTETPVKVDKPLKSYSHWYFGAEYGVPFLFGDFTSFSADKTYVGSQFGGFAGYQVNSWIGIEASARTGYTRMGAKSYAGDYLMNADGMTYYTNQDFNTWKYKDVFSKVHFTNIGLQMNLNVNNFFGPNRKSSLDGITESCRLCTTFLYRVNK